MFDKLEATTSHAAVASPTTINRALVQEANGVLLLPETMKKRKKLYRNENENNNFLCEERNEQCLHSNAVAPGDSGCWLQLHRLLM